MSMTPSGCVCSLASTGRPPSTTPSASLASTAKALSACCPDSSAKFAVHLASPKVHWLDRGKAGISLRGFDAYAAAADVFEEDPDEYQAETETPHDRSIAGELIAAVKAVTKRW